MRSDMKFSVGDGTACAETPFRRYEILGLGQFHLDFSGRRSENAPVHAALAKLNAGDTLKMRDLEKGLDLIDGNGLAVARLSQAAEAQWRERIDRIEKITVIAMVRRRAGDSKPDFRGRLRCRGWEVPVVEVKCRNRNHGSR